MQIIDEKDVTELVVEAVRCTSGARVDGYYQPNRDTHPAAFHIATLLLAERQKHQEHMLEPHPAVYQLDKETTKALMDFTELKTKLALLAKEQCEAQAKEIAALKDQLARAQHFVTGASAALGPETVPPIFWKTSETGRSFTGKT